MSALVLTHTPEDGTRVHGVEKGSGAPAHLRAGGWRWRCGDRCWTVPFSEGKPPSFARIYATVRALTDAGHQVDVHVTTTPGTTITEGATA